MTPLHCSAITPPIRSLGATFMADDAYVADHPNIPRMLPGVLGRTSSSVLKLMMESFIQRYAQCLSSVFEEAQQCGEIRNTINKRMAADQFIAAIQHVVFRALIVGGCRQHSRRGSDAFESYRACMEVNQ